RRGARGAGERRGAARAAARDRLVIGSPRDETSGPAAGAVFVESLVGNPGDATYGQLRTLLKPGTSAKDDQFGAAVALLDQFVLVGAPGDDTKAQDAGAAYVFKNLDSEQPTLLGPPGGQGGHFGAAVAAFNGQALVGAPDEDGVGRVHLFGATGGLQENFDAAMAGVTPNPGDRFGAAIAASGDEIVFGAPAG